MSGQINHVIKSNKMEKLILLLVSCFLFFNGLAQSSNGMLLRWIAIGNLLTGRWMEGKLPACQ
ncbi:hypothetical protein JCM15548_1980 [Geofilum rubicundum JCM 15548]|uniref:Uncharacterized protein n=1 Tax=Geofilum rubicundum JCM 15548 TaxID=1236989 RepID=A0A0E9LVE5_9BACT|nr:hypothetical protein JCM15548_1980 [Geofilum rubicundum JCM 15548]